MTEILAGENLRLELKKAGPEARLDVSTGELFFLLFFALLFLRFQVGH